MAEHATGYVEHFPAAYDRYWAPYPRRRGPAWLAFHRAVAPDAPATLLDVGCGTAIATGFFLEAGYRVTALDVSEPMLAAARDRFADAGDALTLLCADATDFRVPDTFSFALSTYDVANHLGGTDRLRGYLESVLRAVAPGGWFGFELATEKLLRADVAPRVRDEEEALVAMWRGEVDEAARQLPFHLCGAVRAADGRYDRFSTVLVNTWHPVAEVLATMTDIGWADPYAAALGDLHTPAADPESLDRVAIIARRP